jgi:hypothetical protein
MVEYHWLAGQYDRLPALMADLVRCRVAVIATPGSNPATLAAKAATTTIPINFGVAEDPVKLGLVASFARPGGNLTGVNILTAELAAKRLELLRELVPGAVRVAVFKDPNIPAADFTLGELDAAARSMGLKIQVLNTSTSREIDAAFATFVRERPDALFVSYYPDSYWGSMLWEGGAFFETPPPLFERGIFKPLPPTDVRTLDSRTAFYYGFTLDSPGMIMRIPDVGSQYLMGANNDVGSWALGRHNEIAARLPFSVEDRSCSGHHRTTDFE